MNRHDPAPPRIADDAMAARPPGEPAAPALRPWHPFTVAGYGRSFQHPADGRYATVQRGGGLHFSPPARQHLGGWVRLDWAAAAGTLHFTPVAAEAEGAWRLQSWDPSKRYDLMLVGFFQQRGIVWRNFHGSYALAGAGAGLVLCVWDRQVRE